MSMWSFLLRVLSGLTAAALDRYLPFALKHVKAIQQDPEILTNEAKREVALSRMKKEIEESGQGFIEHAARLALELAVASLK
jgi:hypothetical protein